MIDLHSHLLFGIDDGAKDENVTRRMLEAYAAQKVSTVVAASHSSASSDAYQRAFDSVSRIASTYGVELLRGREYALADAIEQLPDLQTSGNGGFLLLDLGFFPVNATLNNRLRDLPYSLLLAHPERLWQSSALGNARFLCDRRECFFQLNSGSFFGKYGKSAEKAAWQLLNGGFCAAIATDAHSCRSVKLADCRQLLSSYYPAETVDLLFEVNPRRILSGVAPLPVCPAASLPARVRQFFHPFFKWCRKGGENR